MARLKNEYGSVCASESTVDAAETEAPPRGPEARAETSLRDDRSSAQLSSCVARVGVGGRAPRRRARGVDGAVATTARDAMRDARACAVDIDESAKRPSMRPSCRVGSDVEGGPDTVISLAGASARDFPRVGAGHFLLAPPTLATGALSE